MSADSMVLDSDIGLFSDGSIGSDLGLYSEGDAAVDDEVCLTMDAIDAIKEDLDLAAP